MGGNAQYNEVWIFPESATSCHEFTWLSVTQYAQYHIPTYYTFSPLPKPIYFFYMMYIEYAWLFCGPETS